MTFDQLRNVNLAEWHAREAIVCMSVGKHDNAEHHLLAAREYLGNAGQQQGVKFMTADDIAAVCADAKDAAGIVA